MASPTWEWLNNPEFARAVVAFARLKPKPENEHRGLSVETYADWTGEMFSSPVRLQARSGPVSVDTVAGTRFYRVLYGPLGEELRHYHIPPCRVGVDVFVSRSDRRCYVRALHAEPIVEPVSAYPPFRFAGRVDAADAKNLRSLIDFHVRDVLDALRILKGWGWHDG